MNPVFAAKKRASDRKHHEKQGRYEKATYEEFLARNGAAFVKLQEETKDLIA